MVKRKLVAITATMLMVSNVLPAFAEEVETSAPVQDVSAVSCYDACCEPCCEPCFDPCCEPERCWGIYGDWLYWRTRRCDLDYAVPADTNDPYIGGVKRVSPGWDNGFRLGLLARLCNFNLGVHWTHYEDKESSSSTTASGGLARTRLGGSISATTDAALQYAAGGYKVELDVLDVEVSHYLQLDNCSDGRLFGGFRFANVDQHLCALYANNSDDLEAASSPVDKVKQKVEMDAYGVYLGGQYGYDINRCLNLFGKFSYGVLAADFDRRYYAAGNSGGSNFVVNANLKDCCWKILSNIDLTLGLNYHICTTCCSSLDIGFGYEFHQWINMPDFLNFVSGDENGEVHIDHNNDNLGFDGFYLRLGAQF